MLGNILIFLFCFVFTYKGSPRGAEGNFSCAFFPLVAALLREKQQEQHFCTSVLGTKGWQDGGKKTDKLLGTRKLKSNDEP